MKKYFIVSDVHGFYDEMIEALQKAGWEDDNPDHIFVSLGDLLDRGSKPLECLQFVNKLPPDRKILILGNHELLMDELIHRGVPQMTDRYNGTFESICKILNIDEFDLDSIELMCHNKDWKQYFNSLNFYYEVNDNIFVHGWIPSLDYKNASVYDWKQALWKNGMKLWSEGLRINGKTIWCGHWHASYGHANLHNYGVEFVKNSWELTEEEKENNFECFEPFIDKGIVAMDACTAYTGFINCKVLEC